MDQNRVYVYGGGDYDKKRQISLVEDCQLKRIGTLPFDLDYGTCTRNDHYIVWCFDYDLTKSCWKSEQPTGDWSQVQSSNFDHRKIRISASKGKSAFFLCKLSQTFSDFVFAVGNSKKSDTRTELLSTSTWSWSAKQAYPYASKIYSAATMNLGDSFYVFGGIDGNGGTSVSVFNPQMGTGSLSRVFQNEV